MRIDVTYADAPPRVIETAGESLLSSSAVASSPEWAGASSPVCATQLRVRTDLATSGGGLVVEVCAWSCGPGAGAAALADFGQEAEVPRMLLHPFRIWEVLPADEVARAVDVSIDGRVHLCRLGGELMDLTAYERLEAQVLSDAEKSESALDQRVLLVHERMRRLGPGLTDAAVGDLYGLGDRLHSYATRMSGQAEGASEGLPEDAGLGEYADAIAGAVTIDDAVSVVMDALAAVPGLTRATLARACSARGVGPEEFSDLWVRACGELS